MRIKVFLPGPVEGDFRYNEVERTIEVWPKFYGEPPAAQTVCVIQVIDNELDNKAQVRVVEGNGKLMLKQLGPLRGGSTKPPAEQVE